MRISNKLTQPPLDPIIMNDTILKEVNSQSNLGLILTSDMKWNQHIDNAIKKSAKRIYHLGRLRYKLPRSSLEKIYTTMIRPILEYGDVIYDNIPIYLSEKLENVQRRAALICTGAYRHTEHVKLLKEVGWESLSTRRQTRRLCVYYNLLNGPTPKHILPHLPPTVSSTTTYNLRNKENLRPPQTRLQSSYNSYFPKTTREWNNLYPQIRASVSKHSFKRAITKTIIKNPYTLTHIGKSGAWLARLRMGLSGLNAHRFSY
jgi:hypothetical protein